jgi:hypothetical protein
MSLYPTNPNPRDTWDVLPMLRELYSRRPETRNLEPWELQNILWSLRYSDELLDESEIAGALEALQIEGEVLP